jgi:hypothetical protein
MTNTEIQIIGRLFDFLSSYEPEDLSKAATSPLVTENVRNALHALARARAEKRADRQRPTQPTNGTDQRQGGDFLEAEVYKTLLDPAVLPTSRDIVAALAQVGVQISASKKDGRARVVERVKRELDKQSPRDREKIFKQLLRELRPTQTEGWFKVIRGEM